MVSGARPLPSGFTYEICDPSGENRGHSPSPIGRGNPPSVGTTYTVPRSTPQVTTILLPSGEKAGSRQNPMSRVS